MRKIVTLLLSVILLCIGCTQNLSKQEYYEKGLNFLKNGNSNGAIIAFKKAIEKDQNFFEARFQLALAYIAHNKFKKAERELLKVLRLNPSYDEARLPLAKAHVNTGEIDAAIREIGEYLQNRNDDPEAYEVASAAYAARKDYAKAEEYLLKSLKMSSQRTSSRIMLAGVYMENGKTSEAEVQIQEVLKSEVRNKKALYILAKIKDRNDDFDGMIKTYQTIVDIDPSDAPALFEMGLSYLRNNNLQKARETAERLHRTNHKLPESSYLLGLVHFYEKKIDEAIILLQQSVKQTPNPGAYYYLGLCHLAKSNLEQATSSFQRAIDLRPEMIQARLLLSLTHFRGGRYGEAEKQTKKVLTMDEKNAFAHNLLGSIYLALDKGDRAMEEFDTAIELNPKLVDAHIKKGAFNLLSGDEEKAEREFMNAVEVAPDMLNTRIVLARYYIKKQRYKDAIKILNEGLKENPDDAILYNIMGAAYLGSDDMNNAVQYFEKAIVANPRFFLPYFNLAHIHLKAEEKEEAVVLYRRVLDIDDTNILALLMLGKIMEADKRDKEALSYYTRAKRQDKPVAYVSLAGYFQRKGDSKKALEVLEEALQNDPENINLLDMKGRIYLANHNYDEALSIYKKVAIFAPAMGKQRQASIYNEIGDYDSSMRELRDLMDEGVNKVNILRQIVMLFLKKKNYPEAEKTARDIVSTAPESETGYQALAEVYMSERGYQKAFDALREAEKRNPDNVAVKVSMGNVSVKMKNYQRALEIFRELEKSNPEYAPFYFFQASTLEMMGRTEDAVEKHKKALELSPDYVPALNNLAYLYAEGSGPLDRAVEMAKRAKQLAPKDGSVTDTLGWTLFKKGNYDEALEYFLEATHYLPAEPTIKYHLARAYLKKGMNNKAEAQLKNAISLGGKTEFPELRDAQQLLEGMTKK